MLPRASVRQVMSHATVFACPSIYEPLGIVNLEAMATETAVVASAVGGIPEVVVDDETGYLVPYDPPRRRTRESVGEFESIISPQKINELTRDPARAEAFGKAGRRRCIDEFSWEKIARETIEVYQAAIERHQIRVLTWPATRRRAAPRPGTALRAAVGYRQPTTSLRQLSNSVASVAFNSTTSRPPPSTGTRMMMPRPSLVTSMGPSPVRGFIAAIADSSSLRRPSPDLAAHYSKIGESVPSSGASCRVSSDPWDGFAGAAESSLVRETRHQFVDLGHRIAARNDREPGVAQVVAAEHSGRDMPRGTVVDERRHRPPPPAGDDGRGGHDDDDEAGQDPFHAPSLVISRHPSARRAARR